MTTENMRPDILTRSGQYFDFIDPYKYHLEIEDIAHGLSNCCRFAGQCSTFYSVAQHSVYLSLIVPPEHAYCGLMHDCAEAFLGDVAKPLKRLLPDYQEIEKRVEAALFEMLGIPLPLPASIKKADRQMLYVEKVALMPPHGDVWAAADPEPTGITIIPMLPETAFRFFMHRYWELYLPVTDSGEHRNDV